MKNDYILNFISGQEVKATSEEVDAAQVFSRSLLEDYNYPKNIYKLQFRVKVLPSDNNKSYPVDITIFFSKEKIDEKYQLQWSKKDSLKLRLQSV